MAYIDLIAWPDRYDPKSAPVFVWNELSIPASQEDVWAWLVRAYQWPEWYPNSADVHFLDGSPPDLGPGTKFRWRTFGVRLESTVREFVPYERLAWEAHGSGVDAYHAWLLVPTIEGCHVVTGETQRGWLARLQNALLPKRMFNQHRIWLEGLRDRAIGGRPSGCTL